MWEGLILRLPLYLEVEVQIIAPPQPAALLLCHEKATTMMQLIEEEILNLTFV